MDGTIERFDALICSAARLLTGYERRLSFSTANFVKFLV